MKEKKQLYCMVGEAAAEKKRDLSGTGVRKLSAAGGMNGDYKVGVVIETHSSLLTGAVSASSIIFREVIRGKLLISRQRYTVRTLVYAAALRLR